MRYAAVVISLFGVLFAQGQQSKIDSVKKVLEGQLPDSARALTMKNLAMYYETVDTAASLRYYHDALEFAQKKKLNYEAAILYNNLSFLFTEGGRYDRAIQVLDSGLLVLAGSKHPKKEVTVAQLYQTLSTNYRYSNNMKMAMEYSLKAIAVQERLKNYKFVVQGYYNMSTAYKLVNELDKQMECADKALQFARLSGDAESLFNAWVLKAKSHTDLGEFKSAVVARDSAIQYYSDAYTALTRIGFYLVSGFVNCNVPALDRARADYEKSLAIAEKEGQIYSIIQSRMQLARVLTMQKKFGAAEAILNAAEKEIAKTKEDAQRSILLEYYARLYDEKGDYKTALDYFARYKLLSDSLTVLDNKKYLSELETKYETEKKEGRIKELQFQQQVQQLTIRQKNILNYILMGFAVVVLALSLLAYSNYRQKQRLQQQRITELETEKQLLATEAVLKGEELERTRLAKDLHDGLGGMLSGVKYSLNTVKRDLIMTPDNQLAFERSIDMLDSSIREMRRVAHNMMPESLLKFGLDAALKDFCSDINQSGALVVRYQSIGLQGAELDQTIAIAIYRIVQELINNTMKHASAKKAIVQVSRADGQISITVEDDGKGFDASQLSGISRTRAGGMGWGNIQNRVEFLKGRLDVRSQPGSGTSVMVEFNI